MPFMLCIVIVSYETPVWSRLLLFIAWFITPVFLDHGPLFLSFFSAHWEILITQNHFTYVPTEPFTTSLMIKCKINHERWQENWVWGWKHTVFFKKALPSCIHMSRADCVSVLCRCSSSVHGTGGQSCRLSVTESIFCHEYNACAGFCTPQVR